MALDDAFEDHAHQTTNRENTIVSVLIIEVSLIYTMLVSFSNIVIRQVYTLLSAPQD